MYLGWPKTEDSEAVLQAMKANPSSSTRRVLDAFDISQFSVVRYLHDQGKTSITNCFIIKNISKVEQDCFVD